MSPSYCPTHAVIHLDALRKNLARAQAASKGKIIAVVKANAYGHGLIPTAAALKAADAYAVASLDEGLLLRSAQTAAAIIILQGFYHKDEIPLLQEHRLLPVVHHPELLAYLLEASPQTDFPLVLEHNSGMHRAGLATDELQQAVKTVEAHSHLRIAFLMTHFRSANREDLSHTQEQLLRFEKTTAAMNYRRSLCNSAALLGFPPAHADYERAGLMLYGASPLDNRVAQNLGLSPAMTLKSRLVAVHRLQAGDEVGYEGLWRAQSSCRVGLIPIGYGDGYPCTSNAVPVLIKGQRCELIGRVSMDLISVNLTNCPAARLGDDVTLWGAGLPVDEIAAATKRLNYDLLAGITARVPRIYD